MLLMWEDGYVGTLQVEDSLENMLAETSCVGLDETSSSNTYNGTFGGDAVELAVAYMSSFQYTLGDGIVGDVAYSGNCRWVFVDMKSLGTLNALPIPEHGDEWSLQFAAGVKTILLVPVIPYGVLQLGSLEQLHEDAQMANLIKDKFLLHQDFMSYSGAFSTNQQFSSQSSSSLMSTMMKNLDGDFSSSMVNGKGSDDSTTYNNNDINWSNHTSLTRYLVTPTYDNWHSSHLGVTDRHKPSVARQMGDTELPKPLDQLTDMIDRNVLESDFDPFLSFPKECELHKALGPAFKGKTDDSLQLLSIDDPSSAKDNGILFCNDNVHNLLENVVTNLPLGENSPTQTSGESSLCSSFGQFTASAKRKVINENGAFKGESSLCSNHVPPATSSRVKSLNGSSSLSAISYEGVVDDLTAEAEQKSRYDALHQNKGSKPIVAGKRKGKTGAKQKPRPRDRQLIQDRLKDLRELVPGGSKCSIDGLLDRTVKHMLFLQSVDDRANKLRQCVQPEKVASVPMNNRIAEDKGSQNGASWAIELGGDLKLCPILVEDLQYPGHMIIEMICEESIRFLEIAEVIHGLNLTILKGVMEKHSGNSWAHYIVEAPKGFQRLDIFWPLMKLLQQQHNPLSSKI
nr:transcription factor EMB1444-like isoform X2 [Erigeron canadensis]